VCIGPSELPWYQSYHWLLSGISLAGAALVSALLLRAVIMAKHRSAIHWLAAITGIVFASLLTLMVLLLTTPVILKC
jgi:hypothetical protein